MAWPPRVDPSDSACFLAIVVLGFDLVDPNPVEYGSLGGGAHGAPNMPCVA
jgi:hypothetical protein